MRTAKAMLVAVAITVLGSASALAIQPHAGWTKFGIRHMLAQPNASAPAVLSDLDVEPVETYSSYILAYGPVALWSAIQQRAADNHWIVERHDEYDILELADRAIDTRVFPPEPPSANAAPNGAAPYQLYLLQFRGPLLPEWLSQLADTGVILERPLPVCGYLVSARASNVTAMRVLPFVQWLSEFTPRLKAVATTTRPQTPFQAVVEFASTTDANDAILRARRLMTAGTDITAAYVASGRYVAGSFMQSDLEQLRSDPSVIGSYPLTGTQISDERVSLALTDNWTVSGNNVVLQSPRTQAYTTWLASHCPICNNLNAEGFRVSIADTGVDIGNPLYPNPINPTKAAPASTQHEPDIRDGGRISFGGVFLPGNTDPSCNNHSYGCENKICDPSGADNSPCPSALAGQMVCDTCDGAFHGTFVAGIIAGNQGSGVVDSGMYEVGRGIAPSAGLVSTKIANSWGYSPSAPNIYTWAADAIGQSAHIQNHSHNQYDLSNDYGGSYTIQSSDFDRAVRGFTATGTATTPITLTVSAGNRHQDASRQLVQPPGTAKNVITVGAAESVRDPAEVKSNCLPQMPGSSSYNNIWNLSKNGTNVQGYVKPDLIAPATEIVSAKTPWLDITFSGFGGCLTFGSSAIHEINTGTSFAAPVAAGAALLASRVYSTDPAAASPALLKAMLIGSTRSMKGGTNPSKFVNGIPGSPVMIGAAPNIDQGFGMINLVDLFSGTPKQYVNQSPSSVLTQGGTWSATFPVADIQQPVKVALVWSDANYPLSGQTPVAVTGGTPLATLLQNDLDLHVEVGNGVQCQEYYGNNVDSNTETSTLYGCGGGTPDTVNNAEKVVFPGASNSQFTVVVIATRVQAPAIPGVACSACQDFALYVFNANPAITLPAPTNFTATSSGATATLSWQPVQGAGSYRVYRGPSAAMAQPLQDVNAATFNDSGLTAEAFYVYKICSVDATGKLGACTAFQLVSTATTPFTDDPLVAQQTVVKAVHITELRTRINALRAAAGLSSGSYSTSVTPGATAATADITDLRTALDAARSAIGVPAITYTDTTLVSGALIKVAHVQELREGTR